MKMNNVRTAKPVENPPGVTRRTLAYHEEAMVCHFTLREGAIIPLHDHRATQIGYVLRGRARFIKEDASAGFEVGPGDSYVFAPQEKHGAEALEETEIIETFAPCRQEYI